MSVHVFAPGAASAHASYPAGQHAQEILVAENGVALQLIGGSVSAPPMRLTGTTVVPAGSYLIIHTPISTVAGE